MAGGHAFLALAGSIGWGIAGASATASIRWLIDDLKPWVEDTMRSALRMRDELLARGMDETRLKFHVIPGEKHSPATWRETFPKALRWIFRNSF